MGASYDHANGRDLVDEIALHTNTGGFFTTATEARRRADLIIIVGDIPQLHHDLLLGIASSKPDLSQGHKRRWFHMAGAGFEATDKLARKLKAVLLEAEGLPLGVALGVLRAELAGRQSSTTVSNSEALRDALAKAHFPVFIFSRTGDPGGLAMLQGLLTDLNKSRRATALFLPFDDDAWGMVLASVWMTGLPPRTGFSTGLPVYDPWLCDVERMIASGEADLHLWVSERDGEKPARASKLPTIVMGRTERPIAGSAVTFGIGRAGVDHDGVVYSSRTSAFRAVTASTSSNLPRVADLVAQLASGLPGGEVLPC
ncbi:tungsten formylmethanofuran dehydrogenase [Sinorhizobium sp. BG8]|uniref:tungsten formylmethanofuran dehydrogenase n=1 Tax=Sinorhizobium sp. BG8 TaxID=2613773 RepID=UPI001FEE7C9F|nr:tungsten formylmethanofuran dehydrogenase [Sinorhizobium sp. BG8]